MPQNAQRAKSAPWFAEMQRCFDAGELHAAAKTYDEQTGVKPIEATLLRVWIHLKKGEYTPARTLLRTNPPSARNRTAQVRHAIYTASANAMSGRFDIADEEFAVAKSLLQDADDPELRAELAYRQTIRYAADGQLSRARQFLGKAARGESLRAFINASFAEEYILAREGRYREEAQVNLRILERIGLKNADYEEARIHATWNLAVLAREVFLPDAFAVVQRHVEARAWPQDWVRQRFETLKALGWTYALHGDYFNAFRWLKHALAEARKEALEDVGRARRCVAHLDRAYLARSNGEQIFERQELEEAAELAERINWKAVEGEERVALLLLAELFAPVNSGTALRYIAEFDALPVSINRLQHFSGDDRAKHLANYSRAMVDVVTRHKASAAAMLTKAYAFFERAEYSWRAGRCALRLYELTKDKTWRARAGEMLRNYSFSWLARELRQGLDDTSRSDLPPMRQRVFQGVCRGLSNIEIANEIGRSEFTVRNHVKAIFKHFGVNSRSALIAEALRRHLL